MRMTAHTPLRAFHGQQRIKDMYLSRIRAHRLADELIKGRYWEDGKGCAVGCTIHSNDHAVYEDELGIPLVLARLEDVLFERLPNKKAQAWPESFLKVIPVGADLSEVWPWFAIWLLDGADTGVIRLATSDASRFVIKNVSWLYIRWIMRNYPTEHEWDVAEEACWDQVVHTTWDRAEDDNSTACRAAARAASWYISEAAMCAIVGGDSKDWDANVERQADKLLELLAKSPVLPTERPLA